MSTLIVRAIFFRQCVTQAFFDYPRSRLEWLNDFGSQLIAGNLMFDFGQCFRQLWSASGHRIYSSLCPLRVGSTHSRELKRILGVTDPRSTGQKLIADVFAMQGKRPQRPSCSHLRRLIECPICTEAQARFGLSATLVMACDRLAW